MLKKIFFIAIFLSLTFPRAGIYIHNLPITVPNIILGGVCLAWIFKRIYNKNYPRGPLEWIGLAYFGYVFFCFLSGLILGEKIDAIIRFIIMAGYVVLFFVTLYFLKGKREILFVTALIIISMGLTIGYGILQIFLDIESISIPGLTELYGSPKEPVMAFRDGWIQVTAGPALSKNIMWRRAHLPIPQAMGCKIFSTFHHGNLFGSHLATFIPLLLSFTLTFSAKKRIALSLLCILAVVVLIFTTSRGALFGLSIGFISLILFLPFTDWLKIFSLFIISLLVFLIIVSLAVIYDYKITGVDSSIYLYRNFERRYLEFSGKAVLFWQATFKKEYSKSKNFALEIDGLANQRFSLYREGFRTVFNRHRSRGAILFGNNFKAWSSDYKDANFYLWMIFEIGLVGFGLFAIFTGYIIITSMRSLASIRDQKLKAIVIGGLTGLIAGLSHNLFDAPFYYPPVLANFWMVAGLIVSSVKALHR